MKILVLGDSIAKGVVYNDETEKYMFLKDCFANKIKALGTLEIENNAMMGCTIEKGLTNLERLKDELSLYEYIICEFGGNDCDFDWATIAMAPEVPHKPKTPLEKFKTLYPVLIKRIIELGGKPVILTLPPIDATKYFKWISKSLDGEAILKFLGDMHHIDRWQQMFNIAVMQTANNTSVPFLDITTPFLESNNFDSLLCTDGIHPNQSGHDLIFNTLIREIGLKIAPLTKSGRILRKNADR